jgi:colanic acid biosynthesis glycosyl transferase WcaI
MRAFIITDVFPPETIMNAFTSGDLADELTRRGHEVVVFAPFPNRPSGHLCDGYSRRAWQTEEKNGHRIVRSWHTLSRESSLLSRSMENLSFGITSTVALALVKRPDVVYMNTWPIIAEGLNSLVLRWKRVPFVSAVQDVYPESLTGKGILKSNGVVSRTMKALDRRFLRRCAVVTTLSDGMRIQVIEDRLLRPERVVTIENWLDTSKFPPGLPRDGPFRKSLGVGAERFVAVFAGSLNRFAGIDLYVDAAEELHGCDDVLILLVGDGSMRLWAEAEIAQRGLKNIRVVCPLLPEKVPEVQAAADVLLLSLTGEAMQTAAPSKLVAYMLSARPTLASVSPGSTPATIVEEAEAGIVIPPNSPIVLARELRECAQRGERLKAMGENARSYAEARFSRDVQLPRLANLLEEVAGAR